MRRYPFIALAAFLRDTLDETRAYRPSGISGCLFSLFAHFRWLVGLQLLQVHRQTMGLLVFGVFVPVPATFSSGQMVDTRQHPLGGSSTWGNTA